MAGRRSGIFGTEHGFRRGVPRADCFLKKIAEATPAGLSENSQFEFTGREFFGWESGVAAKECSMQADTQGGDWRASGDRFVASGFIDMRLAVVRMPSRWGGSPFINGMRAAEVVGVHNEAATWSFQFELGRSLNASRVSISNPPRALTLFRASHGGVPEVSPSSERELARALCNLRAR